MEKTTLVADVRTVVGKKVKTLRKQGLVPANLFGKNIPSLSLQIPVKDLIAVYKKVGETGLVELKAGKDIFHTLITKLQSHPLTRQPIHAEFHAVSLTEKIKAKIPVEFVGESPAVKDGIGLLLQIISEVEVEALPTDLPEKIEVNVDKLAAVDQQILVSELPKLKGVEYLTGGEEILVKVASAVSEEAKKEAEAEAAAKAATEAAATDSSGQAPEPSTDKTEPAPTEKSAS